MGLRPEGAIGCVSSFNGSGTAVVSDRDRRSAIERHDPDRHIDPRAQQERSRNPDRPNQYEPREHRANDRTRGVDRIQRTDPRAKSRPTDQRRGAEHWQRQSHEKGGDEQDEESRRQSGHGQDGQRAGTKLIEPFVQGRCGLECERCDERGEANQHLGDPEHEQWSPATSHHATRQAAPQGESGHERSQHRARRIDSDAEHQRQHAKPEDLVDQPAGARAEKQKQQNSEGHVGLV